MNRDKAGVNNVVLIETSNTQRISVKPKMESITIQKEYRKDSTMDWVISKGIEIPRVYLPALRELLDTI